MLTSQDGGGQFGREDVLRHGDDLEGEGPEAGDGELAVSRRILVTTVDTHKSCSGGYISSRRSGPVQSSHGEQDHAKEGLQREKDSPSAKLVSRHGPEQHCQEVDTAEREQDFGMYGRMTYAKMRLPRKGSLRPARSKKSYINHGCITPKVLLTSRVGADDGKTAQLTACRQEHNGKGSFLPRSVDCLVANTTIFAYQVDPSENVEVRWLVSQ
jgi:hypothetical protein